jgi:hypothetical protein
MDNATGRYIEIAERRMFLAPAKGFRLADLRATHADGTTEQCDDCGADSATFVRTDTVRYCDAFVCDCGAVYPIREA